MDAETRVALTELKGDVKRLSEDVQSLTAKLDTLADRIAMVSTRNGSQDTTLRVDHEQILQLEKNCTRLTEMMEKFDVAQRRNDSAIEVLWKWNTWQQTNRQEDTTRFHWAVGVIVSALVVIGLTITGLIVHAI